MNEFELEDLDDAQITVRDVRTGHRFTFTVAEHPTDGSRILPGSGQVRINESADRTDEEVARRVWNFAQRRMHEAGKIDVLL